MGKYRSAWSNWVIPARLVVGVTGHRKLDNQSELTDAIKSAIGNIKRMMPKLRSTPLYLSVLSPLAEGADRLVVREILKMPGATLEAFLPLEKDDYMQDFETDESKREFEELLSQAKIIRTVPFKGSRVEAYEQVGRIIVDQCDVIIAVWDGESSGGRGGTEEIVQYARDIECPLYWINPRNPSEVKYEAGRGLDKRPFDDLDRYNSESVGPKKFKTRFNREINYFTERTENAQLPVARLKSTIEHILGHYVHGDILALKYQHLYYRAETLIYALALAAIFVAAFQILFVPDQPIILLSEIVLMLAVLTIVWVSRRQHWHEKWLDYRFLAERFRSALFMAVANVEVAMLRPPRHLSLSYSPKDWMVAAFASVWRQRPRWQIIDSSLFEGVKRFLSEAWIEDQIRFHDGTRKHHHKRHQRLTAVSYSLFGLTIVVAILHVAGLGSHLFEDIFAFMAVMLPAIAASITAIRTHRDYLRNSMRSAEMAHHLKELKDKMVQVQNPEGFLTLVKETEETMLHENEDWRVVVRFHTIEPV